MAEQREANAGVGSINRDGWCEMVRSGTSVWHGNMGKAKRVHDPAREP